MDLSLTSPFSGTIPLDDEARYTLLAELQILDTPSEQAFDTIVEAAKAITRADIALISLVDRNRQWFKAKCGLSADETPVEQAFCAHAIRSEDILIIPDARADDRFRDNPLVTGAPFIRFYAGVPLMVRTLDASQPPIPIGTLCVIASEPRDIHDGHIKSLKELAHVTAALIEARALSANALQLAEERSTFLRQLDLKNRQFRQAERMANIGSWRLVLAEDRPEWSDQVYAIHGVPVGQPQSLADALSFYPPEEHARMSEAMAHTIETGQPFDIEADFVNAQGVRRRVRSMGEVEIEDGKPVALIGVFQDITDRYAIEQRLRRSAHSDGLTGLANRVRLNEVLDKRIAVTRRTGDPLTLLLLDLDGFKMVNDQCGHRTGDELLQLVAERLRAAYLADSFTARLGGDEFVIVLERGADAEAIVRRLLNDLREPVQGPAGPILVSATIGVATWRDAMRDRSDLIHVADMALYEAKRHKRGCARISGQDGFMMPDEAAERPALLNVPRTPPDRANRPAAAPR